MNFELNTVSYGLLTSIVGAAALLSIRNSKTPDIHPLLLNTQSDVSRLRHPEESAVYRSRMYPMGTPLCSTFDRSIRTMADLYKAGLEKNSSSPFLNTSQTEYVSYNDVSKRSAFVYQGLRAITGVKPQTGDSESFVGVLSKNSFYTVLTEIACQSHGLVTVPISHKVTTEQLSHIISNASLKVLVVDPEILARVESALSSVPHVIVLGNTKPAVTGAQVSTFEEVESRGKSVTYDNVTVAASDIASIYYTGKDYQHGAVLTHKNLLSSVSSYLLVIPPQQRITNADRLLLNLPINDVFGHVLTAMVSLLGGSVAFGDELNGDNDNKNQDTALASIAQAKPTIFASGSSFLHQVKELVETRYGNSFLFKRGYQIKKEYLEESRLVNDCMYDMFVFRDIRQTLFGGNLRLLYINNDDVSDVALAEFFRIVFSTQVLQTFNLTETSSSVTASMFYDYNADPKARGAPLPCNELKLIDVPELSLTAEDKPNPRGEIWVRGNNVFSGYYNNESETSNVLDADGWYTTGYTGEILPNGTLKVLGKKD